VRASLVQAMGKEQRTTVLEGAGAAPVWGFGDGEMFSFETKGLTAKKPELLEVACFDADENDADDLIGTVSSTDTGLTLD
jgi:hypothetical protein